jgi:ribokinase
LIVVFGSINTDILIHTARLPAPGETVLSPGYQASAGGKGLNQAIAAQRARASGAAPVRMVSAIGADPMAELPAATMRKAGLDTAGVAVVEMATGCACITVDGHGENQIVVASGANACVSADQVPEAWLGPDTTVIAQMEVPSGEVVSLFRRARAQGARTILNLAPYAALAPDDLSLVDILVVNQVEADALAGALGITAGSPRQLVEALARHVGYAGIITLGSEGAVASADGKFLSVAPIPVEPVDTVGAGDAFVGVLGAYLDAGSSLEVALQRAAAAGSLACLKPGAAPSMPGRAAIEDKFS